MTDANCTILHIVPHDVPRAGEISAILPDLLDALPAHGLHAPCATFATPDPQLRRLIADADAVHIHTLFSPIAHKTAALALAAGKPYVLSPYAALADNPHQKLSFRSKLRLRFSLAKTLRAAARLVALDDHEADYLRTIGYANTAVARPAVNCDHYAKNIDTNDLVKQLPILADRRLLLYLGPIAHPTEGLAPMLKAAAQLADDVPDWHVVLAGCLRGHVRTLLEAALRRQRMTDRVTLIENPDLDTQKRLLARAELLACPLLRDAAPVAVGQALAAGLPVVASQTLHLPQIADADAGRVVRPDRRSLLVAFEELLHASPETLSAMGARARALALDLFHVKQTVPRFVEIYRSIQ